MSEKKGSTVKRFFVKGTDELFRKLQHLAIDLGARGVEELGGQLLDEAVARKLAEIESSKKKPR